jgi:hypothetical protein
MHEFNLITAWYSLPPATPAKPPEPKEIERCEFCTTKIEEGDYYYVGYDENKIYAEICTDFKCTQWLKWKARQKKGWKP